MEITFTSSSKINLFLDILGKDPQDGYHFLKSIFVEIPWGDDFRVRYSQQDSVIFLNDPSIPLTNTVSKALFLFKQKYNITDCFDIAITKNVPMGAGLGGGSGDAGALLKWLANHYQIDPLDCLDIAQKIGSDVPFFLYGGSALVEGKGEKITPLQGALSPDIKIMIVYPNIHISTQEAFSAISKTLSSSRKTKKTDFFEKNLVWDLDIIDQMIYNIFDDELRVINIHLQEIKSTLQNSLFPRCLFMTGSGSSFIALFHKTDDVTRDTLSLFQTQDYLMHLM